MYQERKVFAKAALRPIREQVQALSTQVASRQFWHRNDDSSRKCATTGPAVQYRPVGEKPTISWGFQYFTRDASRGIDLA